LFGYHFSLPCKDASRIITYHSIALPMSVIGSQLSWVIGIALSGGTRRRFQGDLPRQAESGFWMPGWRLIQIVVKALQLLTDSLSFSSSVI
jgi:hypothetical protein